MYAPAIIMIFISFLTVFTAQARADESKVAGLPEKMVGTFAVPDCKRPEQVVIFSKYFNLTLTTGEIGFKRVFRDLENQGADYDVVRASTENFVMRISEDGILEVATLADESPLGKDIDWESILTDQRVEFLRCSTSPNDPNRIIAHQTIAVIDPILEACSDTFDDTCKHTIFNTADKNKNGKLTPSEIYFLIQKLGFIAHFADMTYERNETHQAFITEMDTRAREIPRQIIFNFDADQSRDVSFEELYGLGMGLPENKATLYFKQALTKAAKFLSALSDTELTLRAK